MPLIHIINSFLHNPIDLPKNILWRFPRHKSNARHIFVIGAPRSGTTLMKSIIVAHPNLQSISYETTAIFNYKNLFNLERYKTIYNNENIRKEEILKLLDKSQYIIDFFDEFASLFLIKNHGNRFVEKTNSLNLYRVQFLVENFPNSHFIHIYRDGRDCYCSAIKHPHVYQNSSLKNYAWHWKNCINSRFACKNKSRIIDVKYEELTSNPEVIVKQVMNFIGESYSAIQINHKYYSNPFLSNHLPHINLSNPISKSSQNKWKIQLELDDIRKFQKIAGKELKQLGYALV